MSHEFIQDRFNYKFANTKHLDLALRAAHKSDLDGTTDDGNRGLSQMGSSVMEMVETHNMIFVKKGTKKSANTRNSWTRSKHGRANASKNLGLHQHIVLSVRQKHEEPSLTVLANAFSAIIGAIWFDMQEQNRSVSDTIQQISAVLQYIELVVANEQIFGHSTNLDGDFPTLEANERATGNLVQSHWSSDMLGETASDTNNPLDLSPSLSWDSEIFQEPMEVQNELLQAVNPMSLYLDNKSPTSDSVLFEQGHRSTPSFHFNAEASTTGSSSANTLVPMERERIRTSGGPAPQAESEITLDTNRNSFSTIKNSVTTVTPAKRKSSPGPGEWTENDIVLQRLIPEEMDKIRKLRNRCSGQDLVVLLDNAQITKLSSDTSRIIQLRLFYFAIGSCQSLLSFKEILQTARKMSILPSGTVTRNPSSAETFQIICRLSRTEALCVLLKRYHTVRLFEAESEYLTQLKIHVETPSSFGTGRISEPGNPANKLEAIVTDAMLEKVVPGLEKGTNEFKKYRRSMSRLRRLGKLLHALRSKFGFGILALLPSEPDSELRVTDQMLLSIPETTFKQLLNIVDVYQGHFLRELSSALEPVLDTLVQGDLQACNPFHIECVEEKDIEQLPKGSRQIFECLTGSSSYS